MAKHCFLVRVPDSVSAEGSPNRYASGHAEPGDVLVLPPDTLGGEPLEVVPSYRQVLLVMSPDRIHVISADVSVE